MLPQHVLEEGGYHVKGKKETEREALLENAKTLADAGAFAIVLELVTALVAKEISRRISIPTIGIGSGGDCDGQILVTPDLIGMFPWFTPRFIKPRVHCAAEIKSAVAAWKNSMQSLGGAQ
jgi:3-methyl-2-oxobutanoate hydroxymethyltransferase